MGDTYTQVAANATGNKIRNLQVTVLQADGTTATVQMQVIALADEAGNLIVPLSGRDFEAWSTALLEEVQAIHTILAVAANIEV